LGNGPIAGRLMGVFRTIVEIAVLPMLDTGEEVPLRGPIAFQLVGDEHPWHVRQAFEPLTEELFGSMLVPPALHQNIKAVPVLVHRAPQIVSFAANGEKYFIQMPLVTRLRATTSKLIGIWLPKLPAPLPDGFIRHDNTPGEQQLFDIAIAEAEAEVQPDAMADDLNWEAVVLGPIPTSEP
jgi:hypothetical protein